MIPVFWCADSDCDFKKDGGLLAIHVKRVEGGLPSDGAILKLTPAKWRAFRAKCDRIVRAIEAPKGNKS